MAKRKRWPARLYIGRTDDGKQQFEWLGYFPTKREAKAKADARRQERGAASGPLPSVEPEVATYLDWYAERYPKSITIQTERLKRFRADFADHSVDIPRDEVKAWAAGKGRWAKSKPVPNGYLFAVSAFYTFVIDEQDRPLDRNPARKLAKQSSGRADEDPPTDAEFAALLDATAALGEYGPTMRALFEFAAFTLMRPGEIFALEWTDINFNKMRIDKARRVYRGKVADPKTGRKEIALTPPARDAILALPRTSPYVFPSKTGRRLSASTMSGYWGLVLARADLDFDLYHATKHFGVHYMWAELEMLPRVIAAQAGWKPSTVTKMLETYGHGEVGALADVDAAFAGVTRS